MKNAMSGSLRLGVDLGGTKIALAVLDEQGQTVVSERTPSPQGDYAATVRALIQLIADVSRRLPSRPTIGIGMPGSISPATGQVQNANSIWLNGRNLKRDVEEALGHEVRFANDANCFALSEAVDGAGAGHRIVFGVILGTGVGGGVIVGQSVVDGPRGTGGEWGHMPLPWPDSSEYPGTKCWCGRLSCMETWTSGPALERAYHSAVQSELKATDIARDAANGEPVARRLIDQHAHRLARGLAVICNTIDPDVIVLGGGLSQMRHLYERLPLLMAPYLFTDAPEVAIKPPRWGDAGGVRGAAWLWGGPPKAGRTSGA
jgi:fructokinase